MTDFPDMQTLLDPPRHKASWSQTAEEDGQLVWSKINLISYWDLTSQATFTALSSANGTTLTLSADHLVYASKSTTDPRRRVPAQARDVEVRHRRSCVR